MNKLMLPTPDEISSSKQPVALVRLLQGGNVSNYHFIQEQQKPASPKPDTKADEQQQLLDHSCHKHLVDLVDRAQEGLLYYPPELCEEGVNGTYFLKDKNGHCIAVFKPQDEGCNSEFNPKKNSSGSDAEVTTPVKGFSEEEAVAREVAAYFLDREHFYGVPPTALVSIAYSGFSQGKPVELAESSSQSLREKVGSLQAFIPNDGSAEEMGFTSFPVHEVHKIGVLDVQIINTDRHDGNILLVKQEGESGKRLPGARRLIPIDHGYSLPHTLDSAWFCWLTWPQAKQPFDAATKQYIQRINIEEDVQMLQKELGIAKDSLRNMKISTTLLQKAAAQDLTLYDVGALICRVGGMQEPSELEAMIQKAQTAVATQTEKLDSEEEEALFFRALNVLMDRKINELVQRKAKALLQSPRLGTDRRPILKTLSVATALGQTSADEKHHSTFVFPKKMSSPSPLFPRRLATPSS